MSIIECHRGDCKHHSCNSGDPRDEGPFCYEAECHYQHLGKDDDYYCIGAEGRLWVLGNHGDYEAAEDTAKSMGVDVVWMFGKQTATDWRDSLIQAIPVEPSTTPITELEQKLLALCQDALQALHEDDFPELRNQLRMVITDAENAVLTEAGFDALVPNRRGTNV